MVFRYHLTVCHYFCNGEFFQIIYKQNIRDSAGADGAYQMVDAVCFRAVDGCHLDCCHGINASLDCQTYHMIQMTFAQDICCCYVVCAEAYTTSKSRVYFCHRTDVFCQEVCYTGFTDKHVHTFTHFFHYFFVVIAFMIQTHAAAQVAVQFCASCHRRTAKYGQIVFVCFCNSAQCVFVFFLYEFSNCFPYAVAFRPFLYHFMNIFVEVERYSRLRNGIRCFIRSAPEHFQRTLFDFCENFLQTFQIGYGNVFIQTGNHAGGTVRHNCFCIACDTQFAAFAVDMTVDETGYQIFACCVDDFCIRTYIRFHIAHCRDHIFINGNIRGINFAGHNVYQHTAANHLFCGDFCAAGTNSFLQSCHCSFHVCLLSAAHTIFAFWNHAHK